MDDDFGLLFRVKIRFVYSGIPGWQKQLPLNGILPSVQNEFGVNDFPRQWEDIEGPVDEVVPVAGHIEAPELIVAPCLVLNWKKI